MSKRGLFKCSSAMVLALALTACGGGGDNTSAGGGGSSEPSTTEIVLTALFLNAFTHFSCSSGWSNRSGALGRSAYSGSGTCRASFPGGSGIYSWTLQAQTEFDGASPYAVSLNDQTLKSGRFPYSTGSLRCDCPEPWRTHCPDRVINIDIGVHQINTGDVIEFFGDDVYPCGDDGNGAYAKWRGMTFTPVQ